MQQTDYESMGAVPEKPIESLSVADVYVALKTSGQGLSSDEAVPHDWPIMVRTAFKKEGQAADLEISGQFYAPDGHSFMDWRRGCSGCPVAPIGHCDLAGQSD
ncbi:hypothetical protein [Acetobacterium wieringae]|uniref:hypothetical protein n=1 Tax=Acetobacterium wieringae TaxID=52694 RepID=UPI0020336F6E|nr:hypothetical protein [Acetobacterium wieringae]URN84067.1 hypothetical protein CHL1_003239 [Acetobacterium wieringae]